MVRPQRLGMPVLKGGWARKEICWVPDTKYVSVWLLAGESVPLGWKGEGRRARVTKLEEEGLWGDPTSLAGVRGVTPEAYGPYGL